MESLLYICVTILEGVLGVIFFSEEKLSYGAFFSPLLFDGCSVLLGGTWSKKELSVKQILFRRVLQLLLIEGMVLGVNYLLGVIFTALVRVILMFGIAVVFVMVYTILWINEQKSARQNNRCMY